MHTTSIRRARTFYVQSLLLYHQQQFSGNGTSVEPAPQLHTKSVELGVSKWTLTNSMKAVERDPLVLD